MTEECLDVGLSEIYEVSIKDIKTGGCIVFNDQARKDVVFLTEFFDNIDVSVSLINKGLGTKTNISNSKEKIQIIKHSNNTSLDTYKLNLMVTKNQARY